jgi:hypothetical protein
LHLVDKKIERYQNTIKHTKDEKIMFMKMLGYGA